MMRPREPRLLVAFGSVILVQSIAALLWAGAAAEKLGVLERDLFRTHEVLERTARLEEQTIYIRESLTRIENKIDEMDSQP